MRAALLPLLLTLAACAPVGVRQCPVTPVEVTVERRVFVPVPADLTRPAPIEKPTARTVRELRRVAKARRDALETVNAQLREVRAIAGGDE